jgi:hypothetical protein
VPPEQFKPSDDDRGTPDHRIDGLQGLLLAEPLAPLDQEFQVGLNRSESLHPRDYVVASAGDNRLACRFPTVSRLRSFSFAERCCFAAKLVAVKRRQSVRFADKHGDVMPDDR